MADNDVSREDRQLPASERRLQNAAQEGRVPRSRDVVHALMVGSALGGIAAFGPSVATRLMEVVRAGLRFDAAGVLEPARMSARLGDLGIAALAGALPLMGIAAAAGIAGSLLPGGAVFTTKPLMPDFSRLNPVNGLGRLFSRDAVIDLGKLLLIVIALGVAAWQYVGGSLQAFAGLAPLPLVQGIGAGLGRVQGGLGVLVGVLAAAALIDGPLQWFRHRSNLKMTLQEVKDEHKETEGDPHVKGRIRARQREIGRARMLAAVPSADVVVMNPTHYAVALRYDESRMGAPRVVAKGADLMALRIRDLARECGVPLLEAPPLARALYANVEVDREVPAALYNAVAQVLAWVYQLQHHVPGRGRMPEPPAEFDLPRGLDPHEVTA